MLKYCVPHRQWEGWPCIWGKVGGEKEYKAWERQKKSRHRERKQVHFHIDPSPPSYSHRKECELPWPFTPAVKIVRCQFSWQTTALWEQTKCPQLLDGLSDKKKTWKWDNEKKQKKKQCLHSSRFNPGNIHLLFNGETSGLL